MLAIVVPAAFGALAGWLLGVNEVAYIVVAVLAIGGGYFAGREHMGAGEGALRGLVGGSLFGGFILITHELIGDEPKAHLPEPAIILVAFTAVFGIALGAMGGAATKRKSEQDDDEGGDGFDVRRLKPAEFIGFAGAAVLVLALFLLDWFSTDCPSLSAAQDTGNECNPNSKLQGAYGSFSGWETYDIMKWLLLAGCITPFVLAYILIRGHNLSWRPGEITMIIGMILVALILLNGVILGRPGGQTRTNVDIHLEIGYLVGLIGAFLISFGGFRRQAEDIQAKPPGV